MTMLNVAEAKRRFSDLLGQVAYRGETIVISRRGRPMAKLVPVGEEPALPCRLLEIEGWMEEDDPFLSAVEGITSRRRRHAPRVLGTKRKGNRA
jgi:prevent-host-death family protein